jgi:hypothetical protein
LPLQFYKYGSGKVGGIISGLKQMYKNLKYLVGLVCALHLAFLLGCAPDSPRDGETNREHAVEASSRRSADVPKKEVSDSGTKAYEKAAPSPISKNVSSSLTLIVEKMKALGITKENAKELGASSLSTPLVRVNDEGSIQTYVYVRTFGAEEKALLEARDVVIEITNEKLGIIQTWIPFDKIYEVAELPFVKRITPPSYATPRVGSVKTD